jgi:hypothetical protein
VLRIPVSSLTLRREIHRWPVCPVFSPHSARRKATKENHRRLVKIAFTQVFSRWFCDPAPGGKIMIDKTKKQKLQDVLNEVRRDYHDAIAAEIENSNNS